MLEISEKEWKRVKKIHQDKVDEVQVLENALDEKIEENLEDRENLLSQIQELEMANQECENAYDNILEELREVTNKLETTDRNLSMVLEKLNETFTIMERHGLKTRKGSITSMDLYA